VAAIRAALWARSDKQAALLLTMVVQQGLTTPGKLGVEMLRVKRDRRRLFIHAVILDLLGGVRSLGELDMARELRRRGLPEPTRQVLRRGRNGTYYLDLVWDEWGIVVEIDGIHHAWAQNIVADALRHNDVTLQNATVLHLPLLGIRVAADDFFAQIEQALRGAGWSPAGRPAA
jgi:very-short-patch-repair endonuclease